MSDNESESLWAALLTRSPEAREEALRQLNGDAAAGRNCWMGMHDERVGFYGKQNQFLADRVRYLEDLIVQAGIPTSVTPVFPYPKEPTR